ncbi:MAG: hypothetical protein AB7F88_04710 [Pyrinomonadaceae bacterium]
MIGREAIEQILSQYTKHGWTLRRVLLSEQVRKHLPGIDERFEKAEISASELDGLWFSRSSRPGITAWELRHLAETPFALVENVPDTADAEAADTVLKSVEIKMIDAVGKRRPGH